MSIAEELARYEVDPVRGFLPSRDPLARLPAAFDAWEATAAQVSELLLAGRLREALDQLPEVDLDLLGGRDELERAMLLLCIFGNAYVWGAEEPAGALPRAVAVPWCSVADKLGRPPIIAHASIVLRNWRRIDPEGPLTLDNLATLQTIGGGGDEQWFYLIPAAMEARGTEGLVAMMQARSAAEAGRADDAAVALDTIHTVVGALTEILSRTPERCDPYIFYHRVRPFLAGWPGDGIIYKGVSDEPRKLAGGSAAQSSLFQALDAGLGIVHEHDDSQPFLLAMRAHMPPAHRRFIENLEHHAPVRAFVLDQHGSHPRLRESYDACIASLDRFRKIHFELAIRYITKHAPDPAEARGTGGTELARFLRTTREETRARRIGD